MLKLTSPVKYHYFHRFLTYSVGRSACPGGHGVLESSVSEWHEASADRR